MGSFGIFDVKVDSFYSQSPKMEVSDTSLTSGQLHTLLCCFGAADGGNGVHNLDCEGACCSADKRESKQQPDIHVGSEDPSEQTARRHERQTENVRLEDIGNFSGKNQSNGLGLNSSAFAKTPGSGIHEVPAHGQNSTIADLSGESVEVYKSKESDLKETAATYTPSIASGLQSTSATTSVALLIVGFLLELFRTTALIE
ncbi:hypothetical protein ERJ75_001307700 [Trypanosoma vivax]|nr:hypothetical protein TRVL_07165 [Trypanosoma vivax]KAH8608412.1 hypothetical protein ERJ75_001307700 [Trypanosoma vivax]